MSRTSVFEQFHDCPVLAKGISRKSRVAQGRIEALDLDRILQRDRDTGQWSLQIDFSVCPLLCFGKQQFRHTVRLLLCPHSDFSIGVENIDRAQNTIVDVLNKFLDWLIDNRSIKSSNRSVVYGRETGNTLCPLFPLEIPSGRTRLVMAEIFLCAASGNLPCAAVLEVVERREHLEDQISGRGWSGKINGRTQKRAQRLHKKGVGRGSLGTHLNPPQRPALEIWTVPSTIALGS